MDIKTAREAAGLSRSEMAEVFEIPYRTLQNWELGKRDCPTWAKKLILEKLENIKNRESV